MSFSTERYLRDLKTLCAIDSGRGNSAGNHEMARFFRERFDAMGLKTALRYGEGDETSPILTARNSDDDDIDVLFIAHMDTVFPDGDGAARPLTIDESGIGRGPGCVDCKGGCLLIEYLLRDLMEEGCQFRFCVALNSDEERGSRHSRALFEALAKRSKYCFVFEPGRAKGEFVSARKGGASYVIRCHGIAAHAGVDPEKGASAILELARWVDDLYKLTDYAAGTTLNVGKFSGGGDGGAVPDYAEFSLNMRYVDAAALAGLEARLEYLREHRFDPRTRVEIERRSQRPPMVVHEATAALLGVLRETAASLGQEAVDILTGGGSDGNFVSHLGVATLDGCGPCGAALHTRDEYIITRSVAERYTLMKALLKRLFA